MSKKTGQEEHKKWERIYEDEDTISIWRYDSKISPTNPYQVEIKYKNNPIKNTKKKKSGRK